MRSLMIFGNGLGMAIDPIAYSLHRALRLVWQGASLSVSQRKLILACLPKGVSAPEGEEALGRLQSVVAACETLLDVAPAGGRHWLNDDGQEFPRAVQRFAFEVARYIFLASNSDSASPGYGQRHVLPVDFSQSLTCYIRRTESHVATLNYDGLLSQAFERDEILNCETGVLRDGFKSDIFSRNNLFRPKEKGAWYLHLHGCPLFSTVYRQKNRKISAGSLEKNPQSMKNVGQHIVLTNAEGKPAIIKSSEILDVYWEFLELALRESGSCSIFGYSGNDIHLRA